MLNCVSGCGSDETIDHLLIYCPIFGVLWQHVKTWIGFYSVEPEHILDHFTQFAYSTGSFKQRRSFLQLVWLCSIYVLWNERNHRLFSDKAKSAMQLLERIQITTLHWLKAKNVCFPYDYHMWWHQPLVCLDIG
jgi:hypothetical protein